MRKSLPQEYFNLINFFKTQNPNGRIANLPQGSFYGWTKLSFRPQRLWFSLVWYSTTNPRSSFDVWNLKNEQYYWELSSALQKNDSSELNKFFKNIPFNILFLIIIYSFLTKRFTTILLSQPKKN
jgi:hypothetical protein